MVNLLLFYQKEIEKEEEEEEDSQSTLIAPTRAEIQFGGKSTTRTRCYVMLKENTIYYGSTMDAMKNTVDISDCEMRRAPPQSGLVNAVEILNVKDKKSLDNCDFFFLAFPSRRWEEIWFNVLGRTCTCAVAERMHTVPNDNFQKDANLIKHKGWLNIQYNESEAVLRYCILEDNVLTHYDSENLIKSKHCSRIHLSDIPVLEVSKMRFKAVGNVRPLNPSCDFCYFVVPKPDNYIGWKLAFDHHNVLVYESQNDTEAMESNSVRDLALLSGGLRLLLMMLKECSFFYVGRQLVG